MRAKNRGPREANRRFHDRLAARYDDIYPNSDLYWRFYREITWRHLKRFLPSARPARALDLGCGTGEWGIRLLKSGFRVTFVDLSEQMLERARKRAAAEVPRGETSFLRADIVDLSPLDEAAFDFATAQGDPLSLCSAVPRALREIRRALRPGAFLVASVDSRPACYDHYVKKGDFGGLEEFHRTGRTPWLARRPEERFPLTTFEPGAVARLFAMAGFEVADRIGKTVLPLRKHPFLLKDPEGYRRLIRIEEDLHGREAYLGRASHLQIAARASRCS